MKYRLNTLKAIIIASSCIDKLSLPGKITHAITRSKERLNQQQNHFVKTQQKMLQAVACMDEEQKQFILEDDPNTPGEKQYTFPSVEVKENVLKEITDLGDTDIEIEMFGCPEAMLDEIKSITPQEMHYVRLLTNNVLPEEETTEAK